MAGRFVVLNICLIWLTRMLGFLSLLFRGILVLCFGGLLVLCFGGILGLLGFLSLQSGCVGAQEQRVPLLDVVGSDNTGLGRQTGV